jgi:son of sevenless-like protein
MRLIDFFNTFACWVATQILKHKNIEDRVKELKRFMRMAIELRRLNNFNGCQEVLAGLNDSSIYRLRVSWMKVEKEEKLMQDFEVVKASLSPDRSWVNYRGILKEIQPPCIPYLGVYLTDLTFIEDGNPNYLPTVDHRTDIINFEKCRKQALVIGNILLYQQDAYNFQRVDVIYDMFAKGLVVIDDKEALHKLSRQVESAEMVEEAKRRALKKNERDQRKKAELNASSGRINRAPSTTSPAGSPSMASRDPSRYNSMTSRDPSRQNLTGSASPSRAPNQSDTRK